MRFIKKKRKIILSHNKKVPFLRYFYFYLLKKKRKRYLLELKKKIYIQVGLELKRKLKLSKNYLYKSLHFIDYFKKVNKIIDYFNFDNGIKKINNKLFIIDFFYSNKVLLEKQLVPMFLTKFQYNLYNKNYIIYRFFNYVKLNKINLLYLQGFNYSNFNYLYFFNLYNYLNNYICLNYKFILFNYYIYKSRFNIINRFKFINNIKFINVQIDNCIKFKGNFDIKEMKVLNKYLIRARMFRAGKMFFHFLKYMKRFSYSAYKNNLFYRKMKYMKLNGVMYNKKLVFLNIDKFANLKGWFYIYNYIKKYSFLADKGKRNQSKMIGYFIKQYYYLYCFIIKFFYKILYNLKFMFIDKFSFKKILFLKIALFFMYYNKVFKFRRFRRLIRKRKFKKWRLRRVLKFRHLWYIRFLLRIKTKVLNRKFLKRTKLVRLIKKRKRRTYFKFKNNIRIVNWLIKFRRLKGFRNPFKKSRFMKYRSTRKHISGKHISGKHISGKHISGNNFKQLSNNNNINKKIYVKRV
jgi:hypothetical protein